MLFFAAAASALSGCGMLSLRGCRMLYRSSILGLLGVNNLHALLSADTGSFGLGGCTMKSTECSVGLRSDDRRCMLLGDLLGTGNTVDVIRLRSSGSGEISSGER